MSDDWEARVSALWAAASTLSDDDLLEAIDELAAEQGNEDAAALFEAASVRDFLGLEIEAEPLYRRALHAGLDAVREPQAVLQLASTLRVIGEPEVSVDLLTDWLADNEGHPLADAAQVFLALALVSAGRSTEGVAVALDALAPHLLQYGATVARYADDLE